MARTGQRKRDRLRWSKLYTFSCIRPSVQLDPSDSGPASLSGPGFSRTVYCNQPKIHSKKPLKYPSNYISTTKYNIITFLPKAIFEQFRRVANVYFLLAAILSLTPVTPFSAVSMIAPLAFVVGLSMAKEALEDWRRFIQDMKVNSRKVGVHKGEGRFGYKNWQKLRVGDVVKVEKDKFFPADLLLLSSSYEDGICYVETMNLDGETNLKVKRSLEVTLPLDDDVAFGDFKGTVRCEDPNPNLYTFVGNFEYERQVYALDPNQILLRDSKLRNTSYIYGVVIFTGHDTKVMQNSTESPSKRSGIEKKMDKIIYILFSVLVLISLISSIGFAIKTKFFMPHWWYLRPDFNKDDLYNPKKPGLSGIFHLITALILYGYLIPISLYVSIEVVKVLQAMFINHDLHMYDEDSGVPAQARTSNLNEELGQVHFILSDKTGTLTCNQMDFLKCSIAGVSYGTGSSEVEVAAHKQLASENDYNNQEIEIEPTTPKTPITPFGTKIRKTSIKGFSFEDERLMSGNWRNEKQAGSCLLFFRILALCHTAIPEANEETGGFNYEAESPDESAFLVAAREFGFEFCRRTQSGVFVREKYSASEEPVEREFKVLNLLEFNSKRKRMSVIVRDESGQIILLCKGADSIIFDRLSKNGRTYEPETTRHLNEYGEAGLRTLALSYRILEEKEYSDWNSEFIKAKTSIGADRDAQLERVADLMERELILVGATAVEDKLQKGVGDCFALSYRILEEKEYSDWNSEFIKAKTSIGADRDAQLERVADLMERELILVGATAVEDKLQKGVQQCIDKLAQAGLKIWVLTGDKMETAINIGYACSLLRQGMKQICLSTTPSDSTPQDAKKAFVLSEQAAKESLSLQIQNANQMVKLEKDPHAAFALIIDGKALTYALEEDLKARFLDLAVDCASVICCRVSPKQKALVTRLVKEGTGKTTLAIGDGANDVGMIQEADIGVGISGVEGMQAVMASDFSISQFRFLERLLVVHGHWCYKRIAQMICYFFYKNIAFGLTIFYFEAFTAFSGQSVYDDWYMLLFNVVLTSLPVISLGAFEQDVSSEVCLQFPALYQQGPKNLFFDWYRILGWMGNGLYSSLTLYFLSVSIFSSLAAFRPDGHTADMSAVGTFMFTCIIWAVNLQIALTMSHFTWIQHLFVWGSIGSWYLFLLAYGTASPLISARSASSPPRNGHTADMSVVGTFMFTCIIWAVNLQIVLRMSHFTWILHLFVWGSIGSWYLFLLAYGTASPLISGNAFHLLIESLGPAPIYWIATFLITACCNIPYLVHISYQRAMNPLDHHVIQEIKYYKKDVEDLDMWKRERNKARQETKIGFTARVDAKIRQLKGRLHKKIPSLTSNQMNQHSSGSS